MMNEDEIEIQGRRFSIKAQVEHMDYMKSDREFAAEELEAIGDVLWKDDLDSWLN